MGPIDPNHVRPGKNLPGHMGHETVTIQNLEIVKVDLDRNIVLVKGSVPGPKKGLVFIKRGVKAEAIAPLNPEDYVVKTEEPQVETDVAEQEVAEAAQE
jgi:large subunit ribosomal protein L3